ncbi:MAG: hypothetical protein JWO70_1684 [Betaproteobacteria bacterium]|nr:hypothetical protein [Betaproteobacteria bacterium]
MASRSRGSIPEALDAAKRHAVERFLPAPGKSARRVVHRVSADPRHNLVGVGVGAKIVKSKMTGRPSVRLYVARKLHKDLVPEALRLPPHIDGIDTDVIEIGRLRAQAMSARRRHRPAKPGCSIGFALEGGHAELLMAGTFGAVVSRASSKFILSNNHVLAYENELPIGTRIYQPGLLDHGDPDADAIARLFRFIPLSVSEPNRVDCAIAEILEPGLTGASVMAKVGKLASPEPIDAVEGMAVKKIGRGSGYTLGNVFDVSATVTLDYELGSLSFVDQILIRGASGAFSEYGDSGALVVDVDSRRATGLLIGGNVEYAVANHFDDVLEGLEVSLVT